MVKPKKFDTVKDSPLGKLGITVHNDRLIGIDFVPDETAADSPRLPLAEEVARQLEQYFHNPDFIFDLPVVLGGTAFQKDVWKAMQDIEPGHTATYGEIAKLIGSGARAVGNACRQNPVPIIIPCHRIVAATHIGGYAGHLHGRYHDRKRWLLAHEARKIR